MTSSSKGIQTPSPKAPIGALSEYFHNACLLRQSMVFNEIDQPSQLKGDGKEDRPRKSGSAEKIVYIFDADVVHMFMHPADSQDYVDGFGFAKDRAESSSEEAKTDESVETKAETEDERKLKGTLISGAAVCAEYMFSGHLPRQSAEERPYLALDHALEVQGFALALAPNDKQWNLRLESFPENFAKYALVLRESATKLANDEISPQEFLNELRLQLPEIAAQWPLGTGLGISQYHRIASEDLIRPAHVLSEWTSQIMSPPEEDVRRWYDKILNHRTDKRIKHLNAYRDARVITQVERLNRDASPGTHYVLVTGAPALHIAHAEWIRETKSAKSFLRHPRQYMPLINVQNMSEVSDPKAPRSKTASINLFAELKDALISLLHTYFDENEVPSESHPQRIPGFAAIQKMVRDTVGNDETRRQEIEQKIDQIKDTWRKLIEDTIFYNAALLRPMCEPALDMIAIATRVKDVEDLILEDVKKHMANVDREHLNLGQTGALLRLLTSRTATPSRSPAWIAYQFPGFPTDRYPDVNSFLEAFVSSSDRRTLWDLTHNVIRGAKARSFFFLGCTCLKSGYWSVSIDFFERAERLLDNEKSPDDDLKHEIGYCWAVAMRLHGLGTRKLLTGTLRKLEASLQYHAGQFASSNAATHRFQHFRDNVEIASLLTTYLTQCTTEQTNKLRQSNALTAADQTKWEEEALNCLNTADRLLAALPADDRKEPRYQRTEKQLSTNRGGYILYKAVYAGKKVDFEALRAEETIQKLQTIVATGEASFIRKANLGALRWLIQTEGSPYRVEYAKALRDFLQESPDRKPPADSTVVDKLETNFLIGVLNREIAAFSSRPNSDTGSVSK